MSGQTNQRGDPMDKAGADPRNGATPARAPEEIARALTQLEACFTGLKSLHQETAERELDLARKLEEARRQREEASKQAAEADRKRDEVLKREAAAEQRLQVAEAERARAISEMAIVKQEREKLAAQADLLEKSGRELRAREEACERQRTESQKASLASAELTRRAGEAERRAHDAENRAAEAQARAARAEEEAALATQMAEDAEKAATEERVRQVAAAGALMAKEVDDLRARLAGASVAHAAQQAETAQIRAERDRAEEELRVAREQVQHSATPAEPDPGAQAELAKHVRAIEVLTAQLDTARTKVTALETQARAKAGKRSGGGSGAVALEAERIMVRRARLSNYKGLLQAQARKIVQAQAGLAKRHAECDQLMAQRGKLSLAAAELQRREQAVARAKARSSAAAIVFYCAVSLAVLSGLSWAIAKQVAPATYTARTVIEADARGRAVTEEQLAQWQQYHESMLKDPQLMEVAAERLQRRGITSVGTAPALRQTITQDLFAQSAGPGSLTIELKGAGAQKTSDILETFVTTLVSTSNASRGQRTDGIATAITKPAASDAEPLSNSRLEYTLGILGGGAVVFGASGLMICSRLQKAKIRMESAGALEEVAEQELRASAA